MFWPGVFILLWSSGYVAGKVGLPYAGPFTLIFLRFSVAAAILLGVALMMRAPWPSTPRQWMHIAVVGVLIQALQFSGLYSGLSMGVSAGVSALIVGLMPIFTAVGAVAFLGERVNRRQVGGLCLGLVGVALAVAHKVRLDVGSTEGYLAVGLALVGITAGTLYQKKFCANMDLRTGGCIQLSVAALIVGVIGYATEGLAVQWTPALVGSSLWLSLVNSIGAISVLFLMVRRGEASRVASLFYLIPAVTAAMGYFVLGETLAPVQVLGFLVSASGVYLTTRK
jgi:drug/metabolite transporter (DMT)-like permease